MNATNLSNFSKKLVAEKQDVALRALLLPITNRQDNSKFHQHYREFTQTDPKLPLAT